MWFAFLFMGWVDLAFVSVGVVCALGGCASWVVWLWMEVVLVVVVVVVAGLLLGC